MLASFVFLKSSIGNVGVETGYVKLRAQRHVECTDQIAMYIEKLRTKPYDRRGHKIKSSDITLPFFSPVKIL